MSNNDRRPVLPAFVDGSTPDDAWAMPGADTFTNHDLDDGDLVELKSNTRGDFDAGSFVVPRGTTGTVTKAKVPRASLKHGETAHCYADVAVQVEGCVGRIKVPHVALRQLTQPVPRPDHIRRNG